MSSLVIACPNPQCGKPLNLPVAVLGQPLSCPHCHTGIAVSLGPDGQPTSTIAIRHGQEPKAFRLLWFVMLGVLVISPFACCGFGFWWILEPSGRRLGDYDIGQGRQVHIWSKEEAWGDPVGVYYRITQERTEVCPTTWIGVDHGERFEFRTAFADDGKVACVYEVNLAADDSEYVIIYDAERGETWPRDDKDRGRWLELYRKLRAANPDFPKVRHFEQ
jgi:hypothetical protein